jgi:hypothetical protein
VSYSWSANVAKPSFFPSSVANTTLLGDSSEQSTTNDADIGGFLLSRFHATYPMELEGRVSSPFPDSLDPSTATTTNPRFPPCPSMCTCLDFPTPSPLSVCYGNPDHSDTISTPNQRLELPSHPSSFIKVSSMGEYIRCADLGNSMVVLRRNV